MKGQERWSGLQVIGRKAGKEEKGLESEFALKQRERMFPKPFSFENIKLLK